MGEDVTTVGESTRDLGGGGVVPHPGFGVGY